MKNLLGRTGGLVIGGLCMAGALPLSASTLYSNLNGTDLGHVDPGASQVGDQVVVPGIAHFNLNEFTLQYWGASASGTDFAGDVQVQVSFYANDGAAFNGYATPHTLLGQSSWFSLWLPTGAQYPNHTAQLVYSASEFAGLQTLPANFTWAVQFRGMETGDRVGIDNIDRAASEPGLDYADYWWNDNGTWKLMQSNGGATAVNFGASIDGVVAAPEPSTCVAGGLLLLPLAGTFLRLRKAGQKNA